MTRMEKVERDGYLAKPLLCPNCGEEMSVTYAGVDYCEDCDEEATEGGD